MDGWVRTRDRSRLDAWGPLWLTGRTWNVVDADVTVPDDGTGEVVHAIGVPRTDR
ncbi:hypothetical protein ACFYQ5_10630 [Streptomyces sp. NPDC005794]|uniref:hypothetical protein n=1 Tax=Streptomyces sp. NPDC005794 TaxID=3364733 RepID=UPI003675828D